MKGRRRGQLAVAVVMIVVGLGGLIRHAQSAEGRSDQPQGTLADRRPATRVLGEVEHAVDPLAPADIGHLTVVRVSVTRCGQRTQGSGVLVADGVVVTAAHVVGDARLVRLDHRGAAVTGDVRGVLADGRDLALIEVGGGPVDGPVAAADVPRVGAPITVTGHPGDLPLTTLVGERVDLPDSVAAIARGPAFGVSVATAVGMSGAPAVDESGRLVGVVVGAETATGTAIVAAVDDAGDLARSVVVPGRCPVIA